MGQKANLRIVGYVRSSSGMMKINLLDLKGTTPQGPGRARPAGAETIPADSPLTNMTLPAHDLEGPTQHEAFTQLRGDFGSQKFAAKQHREERIGEVIVTTELTNAA